MRELDVMWSAIKRRGILVATVAGLVSLTTGCALGPSLPGESKVDRSGQFGAQSQFEKKSLSHQFNDSAIGGFGMAGKAKSPTAALNDAATVLEKGKTKLAIRHLTRVAVKWPESPQARIALKTMAELQETKNPEKAFITYQILIDRYAGKFDFEEVLEKQMDIAGGIQSEKSMGARFIPGLHNQAKAIPYYEQIISNAPAWDRSAEAQYIIGVIYQSDKDFYDATESYRRVLEEYPKSEFIERAMFYQAECYYKIATGRSTERQVENAYVYLGRFLDNYDGSEFTPTAFEYKSEVYDKLAEAAFEVAVYYDTRTKRQDSALVSYREFVSRFPAAKQVAIANQRIQELSSDNPPPFKYAKAGNNTRGKFRLPWQKKSAPASPVLARPSPSAVAVANANRSAVLAATGGTGTDLATRSDVPGGSELALGSDSELPSYGPVLPGKTLSSAPPPIPSAPQPPAVPELELQPAPEPERTVNNVQPERPRSTTITIPVRQPAGKSLPSRAAPPLPFEPSSSETPQIPLRSPLAAPAARAARAPAALPSPVTDVSVPPVPALPAVDVSVPPVDVSTPSGPVDISPLGSPSGLLDIRP